MEQMQLPMVRLTDPSTSAEAAVSVRPGAREHEQLIVHILEREGPLTHEQIVDFVNHEMPGRWLDGSTVTACRRVGLFEYDTDLNSRGHRVKVWSLTDEGCIRTVETTGDML